MTRYLAPSPRELGLLVRGYRKDRGWTQAALAAQAGLLPKTVSAIETGSGQVMLANVMRCLAALEVEVSVEARLDAAARPDAGRTSDRRGGRRPRTPVATW